jgi:hypothetical protein
VLKIKCRLLPIGAGGEKEEDDGDDFDDLAGAVEHETER